MLVPFNLNNKRAMVTGAANGIGLACTKALLAAGAKVVAVDFDEKALSRLDESENLSLFCADLVKPEEYFPDNLQVDILVNNAGVQYISRIEEFPMLKVDQMLSLMLRTPFYLSQKALPYMYSKNWGRIIGISSIHGHVASPFKSVYVMAKHGMEGFSKALSLEAGPYGVTSNTIAPSFVRTDLVAKQIADQAIVNNINPDKVVEEIMFGPAAIKRLIEPSEVASLVLYLCGPNSNSITGTSLTIDNGWTAR